MLLARADSSESTCFQCGHRRPRFALELGQHGITVNAGPPHEAHAA